MKNFLVVLLVMAGCAASFIVTKYCMEKAHKRSIIKVEQAVKESPLPVTEVEKAMSLKEEFEDRVDLSIITKLFLWGIWSAIVCLAGYLLRKQITAPRQHPQKEDFPFHASLIVSYVSMTVLMYIMMVLDYDAAYWLISLD